MDQGVAVSRFGDDKDSIRTERLWVVAMKAKEGVDRPTSFTFGVPNDEGTEVLYQRYDDADLSEATQTIALLGTYGVSQSMSWWWLLVPILLVSGFVLWTKTKHPPTVAESAGLSVPDDINPLTVLGLLRELRQAANLDSAKRAELDERISQIERHYFGDWESDAPDLREIATEWVRRA